MKDSIQIKQLSDKVILLQSKLDSVVMTNRVNQLQFEVSKKQDLITQINTFYDSAWLKLILVITLLGIIMPVVIQYFQRKNLNDVITATRNKLIEDFNSKIELLKKDNELQIEKSIEEFNLKFNKLEKANELMVSESEATLFFIQGQLSVDRKNFKLAVINYFKSCYHLLEIDQITRLDITLSNISSLLKKLIAEKIDFAEFNSDLKKVLELDIDELISHFQSHKLFSKYKKNLLEITKLIEELRNVS